MTDDRGARRDQIISERVVAVMVRVDESLDRLAATDSTHRAE